MTEEEAFKAGYEVAKNDCLRLVAKWFYMSSTAAKACRDEMRKLKALGHSASLR